MNQRKTTQLQIRVSPQEKIAIRKLSRTQGMEVSTWVLSKLLPPLSTKLQELVYQVENSTPRSAALSELNDFLTSCSKEQFLQAIENISLHTLSPLNANQISAMVETAAERLHVKPPAWADEVPPLANPYFASELASLRLHLLTTSPVAFRRRNIFVDSTLGARV